MRVTAIVKGDLEKYMQEYMERTGMTAGMTINMLAIQGMEYKKQLEAITSIAQAINKNKELPGTAVEPQR